MKKIIISVLLISLGVSVLAENNIKNISNNIDYLKKENLNNKKILNIYKVALIKIIKEKKEYEKKVNELNNSISKINKNIDSKINTNNSVLTKNFNKKIKKLEKNNEKLVKFFNQSNLTDNYKDNLNNKIISLENKIESLNNKLSNKKDRKKFKAYIKIKRGVHSSKIPYLYKTKKENIENYKNFYNWKQKLIVTKRNKYGWMKILKPKNGGWIGEQYLYISK